MTADILKDVGYLGIGSRLKRLADRLLADAAVIHDESGEGLQPAHFPLMAALDRYGSMTINEAVSIVGVSQPAITRVVSELVKAGIISSTPTPEDKRQKELALTKAGQESVERLKVSMWPQVESAAKDVFSGLDGDFLTQIAHVEARLSEASMASRVLSRKGEILSFSDELAGAFHDINTAWIEDMFVLEAHDRHILENPRETIIEKGGEILFLRLPDLGIVGACALMPDDHGFTELTKMGVVKSAQGRKAGEQLLRTTLDVARRRGFSDKLYLVTNWKCAPAIHLYEKLGFEHDDEIMKLFGKRYERCDVAMRYRGS